MSENALKRTSPLIFYSNKNVNFHIMAFDQNL